MPQLEKNEENYFFSKMDTNKDGMISLKELEKEFEIYNIPLTSKFLDKIPFLMRGILSGEQDNPI